MGEGKTHALPNIQPLVEYQYRNCIKTEGRTETILLIATQNGKLFRITPYDIYRSKTYAHGKDYYLKSDIERADFIVTIEISNAGNHHCRIEKYNPKYIKQLLTWLSKNEHVCAKLYSQIGDIIANQTKGGQ